MRGGEYMSNLNERISAVVSASGLNKTKFADVINISQPFLSQICSGAKAPSDRTIIDICREFNVSERWLRTGEGEMFLELSRADEIAAYVGRVLKDESAFYQQKLLLFLSRLSPEMLAELEKVADEILANDKKEQKD